MKKLSSYYDSYRPNKFSRVNVNQLGYHGDIISCLPVSIRSRIISFLPMKEAIRSMVLSRRWRNICYSLSNLDFNAENFKKMGEFKNFVNKTLILCSGSDVKRFSLTMGDYDFRIPMDQVRAWITFPMQHNVQDLTLDLRLDSRKLELPLCLFSCTTLTTLSLSYCLNLKWPKVIYFPMLKYFEVEGIIFNDEEVSNTLFTSSACPVLQYLIICFCEFERIHTLSICFPSLNLLQIISEDPLYVDLCIPILHELHHECELTPKISYETLSSMMRAHFFLSMPDIISEELAFCNSAKKILSGLCKMQRLSLSSDFLEILARDPNLLAYMPPSYCSLKHIHIHIVPSKSHIGMIAWLLKTSPNLQVLKITIQMENSTSSDIIHMQGFWQLNTVSVCNSLKCLKKVKIKKFVGRESELEIVRRLLESACVLEKMKIRYAVVKNKDAEKRMKTNKKMLAKDAEKRMKTNEKLLSFRRVSPNATILIS